MNTSAFQKFAAVCGVLAGVAGLLYLALFIVLRNPSALLPSLSLLCVGLFASAVLVALYQRLRQVDDGFALWGLLLGLAGAGGAAIHAAFDVAENFHPAAAPFDYPSPIDPRGFLTFAVAGLAAVVLSCLIVRGGSLPRWLGYFGILSGILLIALYIAYLLILNATNPLVLGLVLASGIVQPVWYIWLGLQLMKTDSGTMSKM